MKDETKVEKVVTKHFGSTSRARILILLFENAGRCFCQREIMYETNLSLQAVQRGPNNLIELGMVLLLFSHPSKRFKR